MATFQSVWICVQLKCLEADQQVDGPLKESPEKHDYTIGLRLADAKKCEGTFHRFIVLEPAAHQLCPPQIQELALR